MKAEADRADQAGAEATGRYSVWAAACAEADTATRVRTKAGGSDNEPDGSRSGTRQLEACVSVGRRHNPLDRLVAGRTPSGEKRVTPLQIVGKYDDRCVGRAQ